MARKRTKSTPPSFVSRLKDAPKLAAAIASIVGLIAGILGLVSWFAPDAKPKAAAPQNASLQVLDFQKHVPLGDYLRSINRSGSAYTRQQLLRDGVVATIKVVNASGVSYADLFWGLRDVVSERDLRNPRYVHQRVARIHIKTTGDSGGAPFWVPAPPIPGRYLAHFDLIAPNGSFLDSIRTEEFVVSE
ncbi:MAG: hypothetical protein QOH95_347 [Gaiellaceae bacterium]|jgi:hypothetical protein|nr:hypothetical protein [Gaiellaceae bacterium]